MITINPFNLDTIDMEEYCFIAHLYDRILIGKQHDEQHDELIKAIDEDVILEVHIFNDKKEIYAVRINDCLHTYKPLEHKEVSDKVITRCYQLEKTVKDKRGNVKYDALVVKEYIEHDCDGLAYIDKTILYDLKKRKSEVAKND